MKIKSKFLSMALTLAIAGTTCFPMTALANVDLTGEGNSTASAPSDFTVDEDIVGMGATVVLPASLPLTYNEQADAYDVKSQVGVYGSMPDYMSVQVQVPSVVLYSPNGGIGSSTRSMSISAPEVTNEEYPYTYALKWNNYGADNKVTKHYVTFESKKPVFLAYANPTDGFGNGAGYYMYVYDNGEYNRIRGFQTSSSGSLGYATRGCPGGDVTAYYSCEETIAPYGTVHFTSRSNKAYNIDGTLYVEDNTGCGTSFPWAITPDNNAGYVNFSNSTLGADNDMYFSGMIFEDPISGLAWMAAHDGVPADALEDDDTIPGKLRFGTTVDGICSEIWSSAEMKRGVDNGHADMKTEPLLITVASHNIEEIGDYEATIEFTIKTGLVGIFEDLDAPVTPGTENSYVDGAADAGYAWDNIPDSEANEKTALNLSNLVGNTDESLNTFAVVDVSDDEALVCNKVKYLQLGDGAVKYSANVSTDDMEAFSGWLYDEDNDPFKNVKVLVIPNTLTEESFKMNVADPSTLYDNSSITVGNAMAFCKGVDANGYFEYVPHIAFKGTKAQWKALAYGADDWVFSNAENQVVVHCTDGVLEY